MLYKEKHHRGDLTEQCGWEQTVRGLRQAAGWVHKEPRLDEKNEEWVAEGGEVYARNQN